MARTVGLASSPARSKPTLTASVLLFFAGFSIFYYWLDVDPLTIEPSGPASCRGSDPGRAADVDRLGPSHALKGPPTSKFRDNLRNDTHYITGWSNAGFTNEFMDYVNMIYLGMLTDRVPIIPPFAPDHHISTEAGIIPFGDLFDLDYLRQQLRVPVLEWRDVKELPSRYSADPYNPLETEALGCWTTRRETEREPIRAENVVHHLGVDVAYTRVPNYTRMRPTVRDEPHVVLSWLAALIYPINPLAPPDSFPSLAPSPFGHSRKPEEHLTCFDRLYYVTSGPEVYEWRFSWSPVWRSVGRHVRFTEGMMRLGREYLGTVFDVGKSGNEVPPFIAVHIRRGDFAFFCSPDGLQKCLPPLSAYKKHVEDIKRELKEKRGLSVTKVLIMSDESSLAFWEEVKDLGWSNINHTEQQTLKRFGEWYPPIIDIVLQSFAVGFVGTDDSTFSLISQRRVEDWNGGVTRSVNVRDGR